jgi:hypothetical protein
MPYISLLSCAGILEQSTVRGLGTEQEKGCRTGRSSYVGWRNRFLGIESWAPYKFKIPARPLIMFVCSVHAAASVRTVGLLKEKLRRSIGKAFFVRHNEWR